MKNQVQIKKIQYNRKIKSRNIKLDIDKLKKEAFTLPFWTLSDRQLCDIELLLNGGFSPLNGFLDKEDYESVLNDMRLKTGELWPIPITLDVSESFAEGKTLGSRIALRDKEGFVLAILTISDIWSPDFSKEAESVYGTTDLAHPAVNYMTNIGHKLYIVLLIFSFANTERISRVLIAIKGFSKE